MNPIRKILALVLALASLLPGVYAVAQDANEAPDVLVKRISEEVLNTAKDNKEIQTGNTGQIRALVESKILPHVNFEHMTSLAVGSDWPKATPEQQKQLVTEFRALLVHTYSGALSQVKNQQVTLKPMRGGDAKEAEVRTEVAQARGEPIQLNYRLEKTAEGWKIYDISIVGAWLVETYKGSFGAEITKSGIDGLIKVLVEKNKRLASGAGKAG